MIMPLESEIIKKPPRYQCKICSEFTESSNHLCAPRVTVEPYTCTYCGHLTTDPRHACMSMVDEIAHIHDLCRQTDPEPELLAVALA